MKRVILESPFWAPTAWGLARNMAYCRLAMRDCIARGEAPYASHALYTQPGVLDDAVPDERTLGMQAGFEWGAVAELVVVYVDLGISNGMTEGLRTHCRNGLAIEHRSLPDFTFPTESQWAPALPDPVGYALNNWMDEWLVADDVKAHLRTEFVGLLARLIDAGLVTTPIRG
jgi:hypothetical protein